MIDLFEKIGYVLKNTLLFTRELNSNKILHHMHYCKIANSRPFIIFQRIRIHQTLTTSGNRHWAMVLLQKSETNNLIKSQSTKRHLFSYSQCLIYSPSFSIYLHPLSDSLRNLNTKSSNSRAFALLPLPRRSRKQFLSIISRRYILLFDTSCNKMDDADLYIS